MAKESKQGVTNIIVYYLLSYLQAMFTITFNCYDTMTLGYIKTVIRHSQNFLSFYLLMSCIC